MHSFRIVQFFRSDAAIDAVKEEADTLAAGLAVQTGPDGRVSVPWVTATGGRASVRMTVVADDHDDAAHVAWSALRDAGGMPDGWLPEGAVVVLQGGSVREPRGAGGG